MTEGAAGTTGPLAGVRIVDLTMNLSGPFATMILAQQGDHVIQAMTGFGGNQADLKTGVPVLVQQAVVDKVTGLTAAQAISAALFERERTGRGQVIEIPMLYAGLAFLWPD